MICEQSGRRSLVADVVAAEAAGFDFAVISDYYFPWLDEQRGFAVRLVGARCRGVGDRPQAAFIDWAHRVLLPRLRAI